MADRRVPLLCLVTFGLAWIALGIAPKDRATWLLENGPTLIAVPLLVATYGRFRFSDRAYVQGTVFLLLHTVGSHYTYSETPFGTLADVGRNHYDRFVHFAFGVLAFRPLRELAFRRPGGVGEFAERYLTWSAIASWSVLYEVLEWVAATLVDPAAGIAFVGTQGDEWDAQKDMALACLGAALAALDPAPLPRPAPAAGRVTPTPRA